MKCRMWVRILGIETVPGYFLHMVRYSREIRTGSGVSFANMLCYENDKGSGRNSKDSEEANQGLPRRVSPTITPSAPVSSKFLTICSQVPTFPLLTTFTSPFKPSFNSR